MGATPESSEERGALTEAAGTVLSADQQRTALLLHDLLGSAFSARYVDVCRLASGALRLEVGIPLAAHGIREVESLLRATLEAPLQAHAPEDPELERKLSAAKDALGPLGFGGDAVGRALRALRPVNHRRQVARILERLGLSAEGDVAKAWVKLIAAQARATHRRSFRDLLTIDDEFRAAVLEPFEVVVAGVAFALQRRYAELMQRVEELARSDDPRAAVERFADIPCAPSLQQHFYQSISGLEWLQPLVDKNLIAPLPRLADEPPGFPRWRPWAPGTYLLSLAKSADPAARRQVTACLDALRDEDDTEVRDRCVEILAALPPGEAAPLTDIAVAWLASAAPVMSIHNSMQLLRQLARAGHGGEALRLAQAIFRLDDDEWRRDAFDRGDLYTYWLRELRLDLAQAAGKPALAWLCDLLVAAARGKSLVGDEPADDYTGSMDYGVDDDDMAMHEPFYGLVAAVRVAAEAVVVADEAGARAIVDELEGRRLAIFRRLALDALARCAAADLGDLAASRLADPSLVGEHWARREYALLGRAWFPRLGAADQEKVFAAIEERPVRLGEAFRERSLERCGREPTPDERRDFADRQVQMACWGWHEVLPEAMRRRIEDITARLGDPHAIPAEFMAFTESPVSADQIGMMPAPELARYLSEWRPEGEPKRHTAPALGIELRQAVEKDPARYAAQAREFESLASPLYVRRILEAFKQSARNGAKFEWHEVIALAGHAIACIGRRGEDDLSGEGDDPTWDAAALEAAALLATALNWSDAVRLPADLGPVARDMLGALVERAPREPPPEFDEKFADEAYFAAMATLLGAAIQSALAFLVWLGVREPPDGGRPLALISANRGIKDFLEAELARGDGGARVARAVLGARLSWLNHVDRDWTRAHFGSIFVDLPGDCRDGCSAWRAYAFHDRIIPELLPELRPFYAAEIGWLGERAGAAGRRHGDHRDNQVIQHLMTLYLVGHLEFGAGDLLDAFLAEAPAELRAQAMSFVGRQLMLKEPKVSDAVQARARRYVEARLAAAEREPGSPSLRTELGRIGWLFGEVASDPDWLLDRLVQMLRAGVTPAHGFRIVERLAALSAVDSARSLEALNLLVADPNADPWTLRGSPKHVGAILENGLKSGSPETARLARELVGLVALKGDPSHMALLRPA